MRLIRLDQGLNIVDKVLSLYSNLKWKCRYVHARVLPFLAFWPGMSYGRLRNTYVQQFCTTSFLHDLSTYLPTSPDENFSLQRRHPLALILFEKFKRLFVDSCPPTPNIHRQICNHCRSLSSN
jgi:hypothetical protein